MLACCGHDGDNRGVKVTRLSRDTSPDVERLQIQGWRRMSPEARAATVTALTTMAIGLTMAGLRHRHPGESEPALRARLAAILHGPELARRVSAGVAETP